MKATRSNQRIAHEIAKSRTYSDRVDYRAVREENARRAARANGKLRNIADAREDLTWLDLATRSVAPYEVLA